MSLNQFLARQSAPGFLEGHFLVAMPAMPDPRFKQAVIYLCAHSNAGAMGLIINHPADHVDFSDLLVQLKIVPADADIVLPPGAKPVQVVKGGPVEEARGLVLHSDDVTFDNATLSMNGGVCMTATLDIIRAIAAGKGPRNALLALGYAAWAPGQLESEIQANGWLICEAETAIVFDPDIGGKYHKVMERLGVDPVHLSSETGHG